MVASPFLSIILPIYNVEKYLDRCMKSILKQSFKDYEIILVDDGSTDSSPILCDKYGKQLNKVKVLHKSNGGLSSARNAGLELAKGKYIFWLDSDDYISKEALSSIVKTLNKSEVDILKFNYRRQPNDIIRKSLLKPGLYNEEEIKKNVIPLALEHVGEFTMSAWSHIYRRKFIEEEKLRFISEREVGSEDYLFNLQAFLSAKTLCAIEDDLYNYDLRLGSLSNKYRENLIEKYKKLYELMRKALISHNISNELLLKLQSFYVWNGYYVLIDNEMRIYDNHDKKERNWNIKRLLKQEEFVQALKDINIKKESRSKKIIYCLMKIKSVYGILFLQKVKEKKVKN